MIKEAIILAGGLGTRLRSVVSDVPKCMAPVCEKPFLYYLIEFLQKKGIDHFIFGVGYLHTIIEKYLLENYANLNYEISFEKEPLGTGGAIRQACEKAAEKNVLIINGDTFYSIDIDLLDKFHQETNAECSLCLKPMQNFDRYGVVELNEDHSIKSFKEKKFYSAGLINGGAYMLTILDFKQKNWPKVFSFEKDYLEKNVHVSGKPKLYGLRQDRYFIDIGIPEDYIRAQKELPNL